MEIYDGEDVETSSCEAEEVMSDGGGVGEEENCGHDEEGEEEAFVQECSFVLQQLELKLPWRTRVLAVNTKPRNP